MRHVFVILKILSLWLSSLVMDILAFLVVPVALIGLKPEDTHLPKWARMWETYDNDINGDIYWHGPEHANGKQTSYWWRLKWLIRNSAGTYCYEVLGKKITPDVEYVVFGDQFIGDQPGKEGWLYAEAHCSGQVIPCYYYIKRWGNTNKCFRAYLGWTVKFSRPLNDWDKNERIARFVCTVNPINKFVIKD